ncbi:Ferric reductase transmembrane domain-containing protein [Thioalkalivibrio nitratireducens DSM 14787]|uniref:Protein-methionine-sulfoxide reductase heme-binding subunit MsrQ n=1 Tax=Thioalkalivibrio nitratireducens (strain DSM 14787 / UNIQEM 213 / ALEN2) TaxID=1255043 RepID=L0E0B5_THIND|nr:Ferric reductase transmembrane domain-containing protein [Thioalkalivibrio nitratireducens DSM 14787]
MPPFVWWLALSAGLLPGAWLAARIGGAFGGLGVNPIERLLADTGTVAMIVLLVALAVTPLRRLTGWAAIGRLRRMLGLLAFAYASTHFVVWFGVDLFFDLLLILDDLTTRPYAMAGFGAWLILLLLALTSTRRAVALLGRNWVRLHRAVYLAGVLAVVHIVWLTRADYRDAMLYTLVLGLLLSLRVVWALNQRRRARGEPARNGVV